MVINKGFTIIFFGDVVARIGRLALAKVIPEIKAKYRPDFIIVNGENTAHGIGLTVATSKELIDAGIDFITSGNHIWKNQDANNLLVDKNFPLIRPANYPKDLLGDSYRIIKVGDCKIGITNLMGRVFIPDDNLADPFKTFDRIYEKFQSEKVDLVIVGADRIAKNGDFANKIGTYQLAVLAHENAIPFYVAAPMSTFDRDLKSGAGIDVEERDEKEVLEFRGVRAYPPSTRALNRAFDVTPGRYVRGFITEAGVIRK